MSVLATACGTDVDPTDRAQFQSGNVTYTMYLYDAQTGGALSDAKVTVQVGTATPLTSTQVGDAYIVEGVPSGSFPVTVESDGYLTLTGLTTFQGTSVTQFANPAFLVNYAAMYPTQSVTADQTIKVYDQGTGAVIASGQVLATLSGTPQTIAPPPAGTSGAQQFTGNYGFFPSVITAQISNGTATLPRDQLVFGGNYAIALVGVQNSQGSYLNAGTTAVVAGRGVNPTVIFASTTAIPPTALSANNEVLGKALGNSYTITLNFPYPVETCTDAATWLVTASPVQPAFGPVDTGAKVTITPAQGTTINIKANLTGTDDPTTYPNYSLTFSGISLRIVGNSQCQPLTSILLRGGPTPVSAVYTVR